MALFVEEALRRQVPPLALCCLQPADLQAHNSCGGVNKTCTFCSASCGDQISLTQAKLLVVASDVLYIGAER